MSYHVKHCPCCGSHKTGLNSHVKKGGLKSYDIACRNCGLKTATYAQPSDAIDAWNMRSDDEEKNDNQTL